MDIGIGLPATIPGTSGSLVLDWAKRADPGPFSGLGVLDRVVYPNYEPLITLAAAAAVTTFCLKTVPLGDVSRSCNCATGPYLPSWATSFLGREGESVLFTEALDAVVIGLNAVSGIARRGRFAGHRLRVLGHLPEHMLESSGRDDLKDPARLVTGVPKGVP